MGSDSGVGTGGWKKNARLHVLHVAVAVCFGSAEQSQATRVSGGGRRPRLIRDGVCCLAPPSLAHAASPTQSHTILLKE